MASYFSPELFRFLTELKAHNERPWFLANKDRYQKFELEPSLRFISEIGPALKKIHPQVVADARPVGGSLMRIYRDVRFARDKRPYKTNVGMHFLLGAHRKDIHAPGFYLHFGMDENFVAAGMWQPESDALYKIRQRIVTKSSEWKKVRRIGLDLEGEFLTRPPSGFDPSHPFIEDLKRKDFLMSIALTRKDITGPKFKEKFLAGCKRLLPLNLFLAKALGLA